MSALAAAAGAAAVWLAAGAVLPIRWSSAPARRRHLPRPAGVVTALGRCCRRLGGRRPDPRADRRVGTIAVIAVGAVLLGPVPALAAAALVELAGRARRLRAARRDRPGAGVERDLPELVDLLALAVGAGVSVPAAIPSVAPLAPPALRPDLLAAADALVGGRAADDVVTHLGRRWGPPSRPLVHALSDHLRYGTPVLPALERVAGEVRAARRRAAETRARRLPVLLLLPLVLCTLPAFALLTIAPLVAGTFDSLRGGHLEAPASVAP